ncbi:hypothetical protein CC1G_07098 [Coprinopsis cinerea okayama7|uniref:Uncharacterized protein n=1 Tax=Coprinopsis cinerea (strain Okayama-7 / 130 / ATCC MYA-4618 / FGSC 9003) TaxID=240176 RepID=A8NUG4_COPC7|nr:hypothetical protein CC1G_07098 [Coprinopsis cinerea okayama7\|eukprot:XP_001836451.2 hypothetical protein CC1G_07098 [Coprinopsis cinerea okayama7\
MNYSQRYPPPDPADPFAPLWVLRNKTATDGSQQRPHTADDAAALALLSRPQSGSFILPSRHLPRRGSLDISLSQSPPSDLNRMHAGCSIGPNPPPPTKTHSLSPSHSHAPCLASDARRVYHGGRGSPLTSQSGVKQPDAHKVVGIGVREMTKDDSNHHRWHSVPHEQQRGRSSPHKFSRLFSPVEIVRAKSASEAPPKAFTADVNIATNTVSTDFPPSPHSFPPRPPCQQEVNTTVIENKPAISPPIISTLVWRSGVTRGHHLPITSNPIYNNAISVQPSTFQQSASSDVDAQALYPRCDEDCNHGRKRNEATLDTHIAPHRTDIRRRKMDSPSSPTSPSSVDLCFAASVPLPPTPEPKAPLTIPASPQPLITKRGVSVQLAPLTTSHSTSSTSTYIQVSLPTPSDQSFATAETTQGCQTCINPPDSIGTPSSSTSQSTARYPPLVEPQLLSPPPLTAVSGEATPLSAASTRPQIHCQSPILSTTPLSPQTEWSIPTFSQLAYAASLPIFRPDGASIRFGTLFEEHRAIVLFLRHFFCPISQDYVQSLTSLVRRPAFKTGGILCDFNEDDAKVKEGENDKPPKQVQVILIGCGKPSLIEKYREMFELPFRMFSDPDGKVYEALGMIKYDSSSKKTTEPRLQTFDNGILQKGEAPVLLERAELAPSMAKEKGAKSGTKLGVMKGLAKVVVRSLKVGMPVWENGGDVTQLGGEFILGPGFTCSFAHRMQMVKSHTPIVHVLTAANVGIPVDNDQSTCTSTPATIKKAKDTRLSKRDSAASPVSRPSNGHYVPVRTIISPPPDESLLAKVDERDEKARKRDTFVTQTLKSMNSATFTRMNGSQETLGSRTVVGFNVASEFPSYVSDFGAYHRQQQHTALEDKWMESRQVQLERLRQRKDARRIGGEYAKECIEVPLPPLPRRRHDPSASVCSLPDASLDSFGNLASTIPLPPTQLDAPKQRKIKCKHTKARSFSASVRNFISRD